MQKMAQEVSMLESTAEGIQERETSRTENKAFITMDQR